MEKYNNLTTKDIFNYLIGINLIGMGFTFTLYPEYLSPIYFINLSVIIIIAYTYLTKEIRWIRWIWYVYAFSAISTVFYISPKEAFEINGWYYIFFNIPEIILNVLSIHKIVIEN